MTRHAIDGDLELRFHHEPSPHVEVICRDRGPGIEDLESVRRDGFSRGRLLLPDSPRGGGLGKGLGAVERLADELRIESEPGVGTTVTVRKRIA